MLAVIAASLIFVKYVEPERRQIGNLESRVKAESGDLTALQAQSDELGRLPVFNVELNSSDDAILALEHIVKKAGYQMSTPAAGTSSAFNDIEFSLDLSGYSNLQDAIYFLDRLKQVFPIYYSKYDLAAGKSIKVDTVCIVK